jgi:hypothetical protein
MTSTSVAQNGDPSTHNDNLRLERRGHTFPDRSSASPERLVIHNVEGARRQLHEARESLKNARRRVVQLEDAVRNWEELAALVLRPRHV